MVWENYSDGDTTSWQQLNHVVSCFDAVQEYATNGQTISAAYAVLGNTVAPWKLAFTVIW